MLICQYSSGSVMSLIMTVLMIQIYWSLVGRYSLLLTGLNLPMSWVWKAILCIPLLLSFGTVYVPSWVKNHVGHRLLSVKHVYLWWWVLQCVLSWFYFILIIRGPRQAISPSLLAIWQLGRVKRISCTKVSSKVSF